MNTLFIGIYDNNEPNTAFRNAFRKVSNEYREISWGSLPKIDLEKKIISDIHEIKPDLIFMQLQSPGVINDIVLNAMRLSGAYLVQWTGDARQPLPRHYIDFGRKIDLSLFNNQNDVDTMVKAGVRADFLQIAFDHNIYKPVGSVTLAPQIVFMGNHYSNVFTLSNYRYDMVQFLRKTYGKNFGLYGCNWPKEWGIESLMYNQEKEAEVYRSCMVGVNLSHYDLKRYASDRLFRIMGCGAFCISKEFPEMQEYEGGKNFVTFNSDFKDLKDKIDYYLDHNEERKVIAYNGCKRTHESWTWDHRINELLNLIKKHELDRSIA